MELLQIFYKVVPQSGRDPTLRSPMVKVWGETQVVVVVAVGETQMMVVVVVGETQVVVVGNMFTFL